MSKIKRIFLCLAVLLMVLSFSTMDVSAASVTWTKRYDTLASSSWAPQNKAKTQSFTVKGKRNKKLYIQMHVGRNASEYGYLKSIGYDDGNYYYDTILERTRFDVTVKDSKGNIVAQYKNVKYGHVTVFKCTNQKYTVTVKSYFSSFNSGREADRGASIYAQWSASYYYK